MTFSAATREEDDRKRQGQKGTIGLYVHWPFCLSKCPYCDFNSHVREKIEQERWRKALLHELEHFAEKVSGRSIASIFFGGGTPSLMDPQTVAEIISHARGLWQQEQELEVTLEANPTSSEAGRFRAFKDAGVTRLSLGIQALNDEVLRFLGRQHSRNGAIAAIELAAESFQRFSFDLIYARPDQKISEWERELEEALSFGPRHISLYQLTIEQNTVFHNLRRLGQLEELPDSDASKLFSFTRDYLCQAGLPAYEVSNHAAPGEESRHNLRYWSSGDYVGIGPGAHGRLRLEEGRVAFRQHRAPEAWLMEVERKGHATRQQEALTEEERFSEFLMMGLRLTEGLSHADFRQHFDCAITDSFPAGKLEALRREGLIHLDCKGLRASEKGFLRLNAVVSYLLD